MFCDEKPILQLSVRVGLTAHIQTVADPSGKAEIPLKKTKKLCRQITQENQQAPALRPPGHGIALARGQR